ncbi:MAG: dihydrofolate reductase family protein, partial [Acidimicrobiales bacterium]
AILVGAETVRTERYRPAPVPVVVVTRSCALDLDGPLFGGGGARPVVVTIDSAPASARARVADVADVIVAGTTTVDLALALDALGRRGITSVLSEGGPSLGGQLAAAGLLDELCLTLAPALVSGPAVRIIAGAALVPPTHLALHSACEEDGYLFLAYRPVPAR